MTTHALLAAAGIAASAVHVAADVPRIYVNAALVGGANDGSSWADAFQGKAGLRNALASLPAGPVEVWVAEGAYTPAPAGGSTLLSFPLRDGLVLLGGFLGGERSADERDPVAHPTVLSGDLNGNDGPGLPLSQPDNSMHVVVADGVDGTARLDGFIVERGRSLAIGGANAGRGAGLMLTDASPTIRACVVRWCFAQTWGGGVSIVGGAPTFEACMFTHNQSSFGGGGLMHDAGAAASFLSCQFVANTGGRGAGLFNASTGRAGLPAIVDCVFSENQGSIGLGSGAGLYDEGGSPLIERCAFRSNATGAGGGGIYLERSTATIRSCDFTGNRGTNDGGGAIHVDGGFVAGAADPLIANSRFLANNGAIFLRQMAHATVVHCTIADNTHGFAFPTWPALFATGTGTSLSLAGSIVWGNLPAVQPGFAGTVMAVFGAVITAEGCSMQFFDGSLPGGGNGAFDPIFVDADGADGVVGTADDDVHVGPGSQCLDRGDAGNLPAGIATDLDGQPRVRDGDGDGRAVIDLGCYERGPRVVVGDLDGDATVGGSDLAILLGSWGRPGPADLDGDGTTDAADLAILLGAWGSW